MSLFRNVATGLRAICRKNQVDRELDEELGAYLEMEAAEKMKQGMSRKDALRAVRLERGSLEITKEVVRSGGWESFVNTCWQHFRFGLRSLRKSPAFAVVAVLTLALGIGVNTAIFSCVDEILLRPLPFPKSDQLMQVFSTRAGAELPPSPLDARDLNIENHTFEGLALYDIWPKNVAGLPNSTRAELGFVGMVQSGWFHLLRIRPVLGRLSTSDEDKPAREHVVMLGEGFWRQRFHGDPKAIGQIIRINEEAYQIIGVVPDAVPNWLTYGGHVSLWTPFVPYSGLWNEANRGNRGFSVLGRLKPSVTLAQARADLSVVSSGLAARYPADREIGATARPLLDMRVGESRPMLFLLLGSVGLILLIACANLANLLLARNTYRYREIAVRAALGASRRALILMLFSEALILSLAGGVLGLLVSYAVSQLVVSLHPDRLPQVAGQILDWRVMLFTLGASLLTTMLFGIAPALANSRVNFADALREAGRTGMTGVAHQHLRRVLVAAEMALSLMLLIGVGLLVRSMFEMQKQDLGFSSQRLLTAHFYLPRRNATAITQFTDDLSRRVDALPGVKEASIAAVFPPRNGWVQQITVERHPATDVASVPEARFNVVDWHYCRTLGLRLLQGRDFGKSDTETTQPVALINETFARRFFSGEDAVGQLIHLGPPESLLSASESASPRTRFTVVGIVRDAKNSGLVLPPGPEIIALFRQTPDLNYGFKRIIVRTLIDPHELASPLQQAVQQIDSDIPVTDVLTMNEVLAKETADSRFMTIILGSFSFLGLALASIGVYGVLSYLVAQRKQEIGVRLALGASRSQILWMTLRQGITIALLGSGCGLMGAFGAQRAISSFLFGVSPVDAVTLSSATLLILCVAAIACTVPAYRATRIDPIVTLRYE